MSKKILIADDSLTIQKVVSIALANEPYELHQATDEGALMSQLNGQQFDLILLDFNLSESMDGYELANKVQSINPGATLFALLGTFDSPDEERLMSAGYIDKFIKPFDTVQFIKRCRQAIEERGESQQSDTPSMDSFDDFDDLGTTDPTEQIIMPDLSETVGETNEAEELDSTLVDYSTVDLEDAWQINEEIHSVTEVDIGEDSGLNDNLKADLEDEVQEWGIEVPSVIEKEDDRSDTVVPDVIEGPEVVQNAEPSEPTEPSDFGLGGPTSQLISLDELAVGDDDDFEEETDPGIKPNDDEFNFNLDEELGDEVNSDDFWIADTREISLDDFKASTEGAASNVDIGRAPAVIDEETKQKMIEDLREEVLSTLKESLEGMAEQIAKETCEKISEKVAWEVIPDLAENLIKAELEKIREDMMPKS